MSNSIVLACHNVAKTYMEGEVSTSVLSAINLQVMAGQRIAIIGPSGSGKSTLLHILGGLDDPSSGQVVLAGHDLAASTETQRCQLRNRHLGFVYQFHHLLPEFTALENVAMPLLIAGSKVSDAMVRAAECLADVGLTPRAHHKIGQLSGGEKQRTAIARALVTSPTCLLADEPTGNLDQTNAHKVIDLLLSLKALTNTAMLVVTHDLQLAARLDAVYRLENGYLQQQ